MDDVGLDGLTMRSLAERLEVTPGSLYRHVHDKNELLILVADEIAGQIPVVGLDAPWQQALTEGALALRRVLLGHRDAARLMASLPPAGPRRLDHIEAMLGVLLKAGFSSRDAAWAAYHFNNLVTEFVADEVRQTSAAAALGRTPGELLAEARAQFEALPADQFPSLTRAAAYLTSDDSEAVFEFGLRLMLLGLEQVGVSAD
jgi:AcrR family transcriptional regulator